MTILGWITNILQPTRKIIFVRSQTFLDPKRWQEIWISTTTAMMILDRLIWWHNLSINHIDLVDKLYLRIVMFIVLTFWVKSLHIRKLLRKGDNRHNKERKVKTHVHLTNIGKAYKKVKGQNCNMPLLCYLKKMVKQIMTLWATRVLSLARPSVLQKEDPLIEIKIKKTRQGKIAMMRRKMIVLRNFQTIAQLPSILLGQCMANQRLPGLNPPKKLTSLLNHCFRGISKETIQKQQLNKQ